MFGEEKYSHCYRHIKENFNSFLTKHNTNGRNGKQNALEMLDAVVYTYLDSNNDVVMEVLRLLMLN